MLETIYYKLRTIAMTNLDGITSKSLTAWHSYFAPATGMKYSNSEFCCEDAPDAHLPLFEQSK
jgi:hypothetical protein